jgi:hypothetical protein
MIIIDEVGSYKYIFISIFTICFWLYVYSDIMDMCLLVKLNCFKC